MKCFPHLTGLALAACVLTTVSVAQEAGQWRASSTTAKGVTGDIGFTDTRVILNFAGYTLAEIRALQPDELSALFNGGADANGTGHMFRTEIPGEKRFAHKNTLCGSEPVQWILTSVSGKKLQVAMFSGAQMPKLTAESLANTTSLCGTYSYTR